MKKCEVSVLFAYLSIIYISTSILYLIISQSYGTPFKDVLSKYPELMKIKNESVKKRKNLFYIGIIISSIIFYILNPFGDCF